MKGRKLNKIGRDTKLVLKLCLHSEKITRRKTITAKPPRLDEVQTLLLRKLKLN